MTLEAEEALQSLKRYLASPLLLYIAATNQVVSAILVVERDAPVDKIKGKHPRNTLPGQPSKKRASGADGSKDHEPSEPASATVSVVEEA